MKNFLFAVFLLCLAIAFSSCSFEGDVEETQLTTEETYFTEPVEGPSAYEILQERTGLVDFDSFIYGHDMEYTITYQRELLGGTYLLWEQFDIFERNDKIYLSATNLRHETFLIELSEEQCEKILSLNNPRDIVVAFNMNEVCPISSAYYPWYEYETKDVWDIDTGEYLGDFIDEDSIYAYIEVSSRYRLIKGTCVEIYTLD